MKKHDINQLAAWARDWGLDGYEQYDPKNKEKTKIQGLKRMRQKEEKRKDTKNALNGAFFYLQSIINSVIIPYGE